MHLWTVENPCTQEIKLLTPLLINNHGKNKIRSKINDHLIEKLTKQPFNLHIPSCYSYFSSPQWRKWHVLRNTCSCFSCTSNVCMSAKSLQLCLTLCNPMDCSPPGSSVHGILQARIREWVAMPCSRGSSQPRDQTCVSYVSCIGRWSLCHGAMCEALTQPIGQ